MIYFFFLTYIECVVAAVDFVDLSKYLRYVVHILPIRASFLFFSTMLMMIIIMMVIIALGATAILYSSLLHFPCYYSRPPLYLAPVSHQPLPLAD